MSLGNFCVRGYQNEMFDRSMKGNVIVAMDTGSGKTAIAVLRMMAELDRCSEKHIWFMAPTVALCIQQHKYIRSHIPAATTRLLAGSDNVDRWSEQRIWDAVLNGTQIVVSTHAVLADALNHGFVKISQLALLVFDEAHHCIRGHKANRIMQDFYHPTKDARGSNAVPHILGLSASPILRSKLSELSKIERNLDAFSITPRLHRQELLKHVHHPDFQRLCYVTQIEADLLIPSPSLRALGEVVREVALEHESIQQDIIAGISRPLGYQPSITSQHIEWVDQLNRFHQKAKHIYEELGAWAADYFISQTIGILRAKSTLEENLPTKFKEDVSASLLRVLDKRALVLPPEELSARSNLSSKVETLIAFLTSQDSQEHAGLIFVRQRAVVSVLHRILSTHPLMIAHFRCATFVGLSGSSKRTYKVSELLDLKAQQDTMGEFRAGRKNLIIATDVLEEGIDVIACNLVICFDRPPTLKSFIQRRGRARMQRSKFAIMLPLSDAGSEIDYWQELEAELIKTYQDEERARLMAAYAKNQVEEEMNYRLHVPCTGATLTADSTTAHLHHFCARLPDHPYVDMQPAFSFTEDERGLITATVTLPSCVTSSVRSARGEKAWQTECTAAKDAAFQCYVALYNAGLINDNLLPLTHDWQNDVEQSDQLPGTVKVDVPFMSALQMSKAWSSPDPHQTKLLVQSKDCGTIEQLSMLIITPIKLNDAPALTLYWNAETTFTITFESAVPLASLKSDSLLSLRGITQLLHQSTHSDSKTIEKTDFVFLFSPDIEEDGLVHWLATNRGREKVSHILKNRLTAINGFVRTPSLYGAPHTFCRWHLDRDIGPHGILEFECCPLPKRRNFEAPNILSTKTTTLDHEGTSTVRLSTTDCTVDHLGSDYARFNLFVPSILQHIEAYTTAAHLRNTILANVKIEDVQHVVTAITAPSANWRTDYQRYEFIGDAILKFVTSVQLYEDHSAWPEGYLSQRRDSLISNNNLAKAALRKGLGVYILTEAPKGRNWSPPLISDASQSEAKRDLPTKVLADVTEALIGAAFIDSGLQSAMSCINVFLPEIRVTLSEMSVGPLTGGASIDVRGAESLIGYKFRKTALLMEALTHATYASVTGRESYQRLEFLGDAVLDLLVVNHLSRCKPALSQGRMTRVKAALVNSGLLGFICLDFGIERDVVQIEEKRRNTFSEVRSTEKTQLWRYMRHHSQAVLDAQGACNERYDRHYHEIRSCIQNGDFYPWALLARLNPDKFYSDMVESIIGAIFVDSQRDILECQRFIDRIGFGSYACLITKAPFDMTHPRATLQQLAGRKKVEFAIDSYKEAGSASALFHCRVLIDGVNIAEVDKCLSSDEAVVLGADAAVVALSAKDNRA